MCYEHAVGNSLIYAPAILLQVVLHCYLYVTGFAKTVPNGTRIEIQIIA